MPRYIDEPPAAGGDLLTKCHIRRYQQRSTISDSNNSTLWVPPSFTTTTDNAVLVVRGQFWGVDNASDMCGAYAELKDNSGNSIEGGQNDSPRHQGVFYAGVNQGANWARHLFTWHKIYTNVSPGTYRMYFGWHVRDGGSGNRPFERIDPNGSDDGRTRPHERLLYVWELSGGDGLSTANMTSTSW